MLSGDRDEAYPEDVLHLHIEFWRSTEQPDI
jgi:hypothetical protein